MPLGPAFWRSNSTSNAGAPGAWPGSAREGAVATRQRVCAALGTGSASMRSRNSGTPDFSAASVRRRLAVRSRSRILPRLSTTTAPSAAQRSASTAARSKSLSSATSPNRQAPGTPPSSAKPAACNTPPCTHARRDRSHSIVSPVPINSVSAKAKPATAAASVGSAPYISCTHPRINPPPRTLSIGAIPLAQRRKDAGLALARVKAGANLICSLYVPTMVKVKNVCAYFFPGQIQAIGELSWLEAKDRSRSCATKLSGANPCWWKSGVTSSGRMQRQDRPSSTLISTPRPSPPLRRWAVIRG